jgi:hypothetical protein
MSNKYMNKNWSELEFNRLPISDDRVVKRLIKTAQILGDNPQKTIPNACNGKWSDIKATYRLFDNKSLTPQAIIMSHREQTIERMKNYDVVLAVQDTTSLDYSHHPNTEGLGLISTSQRVMGLMCHTSMAVTTNGVPLGLLAQKFWRRDPAERGKTQIRKELNIKEKESHKWLELLEQSNEGIPEQVILVTVCDREADIYELFLKAIKEKKELLVRGAWDRRITEGSKRLKKEVESKPEAGEVIVNIPKDTKNKRPPRTAKLRIKFATVTARPPKTRTTKLKNIKIQAILAEEIEAPQGVKPINWLLVTTLPINTLEDAVEKIKWYSHRWKIEQYHMVLKSGCKVEELQLETSERLEKALALYSVIAWRVTYLKFLSEESADLPCTMVFRKHEWQALYCYVHKTPTPPKNPISVEEATLLVGKLGGYIGRKSDPKPGVKVLWRGMMRLTDIAEFWLITHPDN